MMLGTLAAETGTDVFDDTTIEAQAPGSDLAAHQLPPERALLRLDGQYGTGAVLADLAGFSFLMRGKDYAVLDHPLVKARLHLPPDQLQHRTAKSASMQPLRLP